MRSETSEIQLAGQAYSKIGTIITVGLVVALKTMLVNVSVSIAMRGQPGPTI